MSNWAQLKCRNDLAVVGFFIKQQTISGSFLFKFQIICGNFLNLFSRQITSIAPSLFFFLCWE